jgi:LPXTG-motif cell wall-anchored protein
MPKATAQRIAIVCLVLAGVDIALGQKTLAMVFAGAAILVSLGAGLMAGRKNRK